MPDELDWTSAAISKARQQEADVPDVIWAELEALLKGKLSQRPLPPGELASVAMQLIGEMGISSAGSEKS